jgi:hypothetical protein
MKEESKGFEVVHKLHLSEHEFNVIHKAMSKEESKYYTPEMEEFHVGFECEGKWFSQDEIGFGEITIDIHNIHTAINNPTVFRVKHLDREDIESLGFKFKPYGDIESYENDVWQLLRFQYPKEQVRLIHKVGSTRFFNGTIKNKSELKRILKQIGCLS